jgi:formate dehydrogenase major subunit
MDPRGQALRRHATHMLQFKPGTDVALLNAMLNVIITEELYDEQYVQAHTEGFERSSAMWPLHPGGDGAGLRHRRRDIREVARTYATAERRSSSGAWASRSTRTAPTTRAA